MKYKTNIIIFHTFQTFNKTNDYLIKMMNFQTYKKSRFIFQILYINASYFLSYLKQINKETEKSGD